jgi:chemotaxis protein CheY-P-specific phosphatase CheC
MSDLTSVSQKASSHLQEVLGKMLNMTFTCTSREYEGVSDDLLLPESQSYLAIYFPVQGDTTGSAHTMFTGESIRHISECMLANIGKNIAGIEFQELANILTGSYLTVFSNECDKKIIHASAEGESLSQLSPDDLRETLKKNMASDTTTVQTTLEDAEKGVTIVLCVTVKSMEN